MSTTRDENPSEPTSAHVQRAVDGDERSLTWIVSRFQPLVVAHIRFRLGSAAKPSDVDDLSQDVWFTVMQKLQDLRSHDGHFGAVLATFLSTTSTFLCNNFLRKALRRGSVTRSLTRPPGRDDDGDYELMALTTGVVTRVTREETKSRLAEAMDQLAPEARDILVLRLFEQQSLRTIATTLELPRARVTTTYRAALEQLRRDLPDDAFEAIRSCTVRVRN